MNTQFDLPDDISRLIFNYLVEPEYVLANWTNKIRYWDINELAEFHILDNPKAIDWACTNFWKLELDEVSNNINNLSRLPGFSKFVRKYPHCLDELTDFSHCKI